MHESNVRIILHLPLPDEACPQIMGGISVVVCGGIVVLILKEFQMVVKLNVQFLGETSHC